MVESPLSKGYVYMIVFPDLLMASARIETEKRLRIANQLVEYFESFADAVLITGSVAYSPDYLVTAESDIDLLVIAENPRDNIGVLIQDIQERKNLQYRFFEGYCIQDVVEDVPLSVHVLSKDALEVMSKLYVGDIRVYRSNPKRGSYSLKNFSGAEYEYDVKNISLDDLTGFRTIVPVSFIYDDSYFIGVHRDKLLSNPQTLYDSSDYVQRCIDDVWLTVSQNLVDESIRRMGRVDLSEVNVLNALAKAPHMTASVRESIVDKTQFYVSRVRG